jgi:hypothetical protein
MDTLLAQNQSNRRLYCDMARSIHDERTLNSVTWFIAVRIRLRAVGSERAIIEGHGGHSLVQR